MRQKVQFFYDEYQSKDQETEELKNKLKEMQSNKFRVEADLAREKEKTKSEES